MLAPIPRKYAIFGGKLQINEAFALPQMTIYPYPNHARVHARRFLFPEHQIFITDKVPNEDATTPPSGAAIFTQTRSPRGRHLHERRDADVQHPSDERHAVESRRLADARLAAGIERPILFHTKLFVVEQRNEIALNAAKSKVPISEVL